MDNQGTKAPSMKERIIQSEFGWLKDFDVTEVDGKRMMTLKGDNLPFNVSHILTEDEFIRDWLMPFALGNDLGINYFPAADWLKISADGTQSVMVVDATNEPMLIIPPLASHNFGPEQYKVFRKIELALKQIAEDTMAKGNPQASAFLTDASAHTLKDVKRRSITDLVSPWYYAKHKIIPDVERQVYFIRDSIHKGNIDPEHLTKARPILYKAWRNEPVTEEEKKFIESITPGFDINYGDGSAKSVDDAPAATTENANKASCVEEDFDPLSC